MTPPSHAVRQRRRRGDTRRRILDAARELLEQEPWSEISLEQIMQRADLTRTAFYRHFGDRQLLLLALIDDVGLTLDTVADPWEQGEGDPVAEVEPAIGRLTDVFVRHGRLLRAIADAATQDPDIDAFYTELGRRLSESAAARIAADVEAGRSHVTDPEEVAAALVWMNERYLLVRFGQAPLGDRDRAAAALTEIWRRTVYGPP
jgi:TetR/AcrR family transcriptional regulator, ethionamide resistance regulator